MAERRMFSRRIIKTDPFMDMPVSSQALYFHFAMDADDDGFVSNPKITMKTLGSSDDDMKILLAKKFILMFESGVVLIKHWLVHNEIKKDRYNPTSHINERESIMVKENRAYSMRSGQPMNKWIQHVSNMDTQVRLDKVRIGKTIKRTKSEMEEHHRNFERIWSIYPKKVGKQACIAWWDRHKIDAETVEKIIKAVEKYKLTRQWKEGFIPHPRTFFNQARWEDEIEAPVQASFKSYNK